jgi:N-acetylneuraminic acid mutarotase
VTASVLKFDSAQGIWSEFAPMPGPREVFACCAYKSDIYVFGGNDEEVENQSAQASVFKFDTEANEWTTQAPMPLVCAYHNASILNGQVYITGAGDSGREVLRFDVATSAWSTLAQTIDDRAFGVSFVLAGCLYVAGGGNNASASVERYDVATDTWTELADMLTERRYFRAVCIESEGPTEEQNLFDSLIVTALIQRT